MNFDDGCQYERAWCIVYIFSFLHHVLVRVLCVFGEEQGAQPFG